jgi:hypothetical protein
MSLNLKIEVTADTPAEFAKKLLALAHVFSPVPVEPEHQITRTAPILPAAADAAIDTAIEKNPKTFGTTTPTEKSDKKQRGGKKNDKQNQAIAQETPLNNKSIEENTVAPVPAPAVNTAPISGNLENVPQSDDPKTRAMDSLKRLSDKNFEVAVSVLEGFGATRFTEIKEADFIKFSEACDDKFVELVR